MKKLLFISFLITSKLTAQDLKIMRFEEFEALNKPKDDKIYVFNFWATYCKPCVTEMPNFQKVSAESKGKIELIFVSLDFVKDKQKVLEFIKTKAIKEQVVLLNEPDYDAWINKVSKDWSGALPATLILNKNKREFYEQTFDYQGFMSKINEF